MNRKTKRYIAIFVGAVLFVGSLFLFIRINLKYKNPTIEEASLNEAVRYNGYEFVVQSGYFLNDDELLEVWGDDLNNYSDAEAYMVTIDITKVDADADYISLGNFELLSETYRQGPDLLVFRALNDHLSKLFNELDQGETQTYIFPYMLVKEQFSNSQWKKIKERQYNIVFTLYPIMKMVRIQ